MAKGFAKNSSEDDIWVESQVNSRNLQPAVVMKWGKNTTQLTPQQARHHAYSILSAIAAAELDSCLIQWLVKKIGIKQEEAGVLLVEFRKKRRSNEIPSVTLNFDGEHIRPDTAREYATWMLDAAFGAEMEAFLVAFALQDLEQSPEFADQLIQEFREMRGVVTMWPEEDRKRKSAEKNDSPDGEIES